MTGGSDTGFQHILIIDDDDDEAVVAEAEGFGGLGGENVADGEDHL